MSKINSAASGAATGASVGGPWGAVVGGVAGYLMGSDDESGGMYDSLLAEARNLPLPVLKEYYPELYRQVVSLNPDLETSVELGPSEMAGVATDPALRQAQLNALSKLQEVGDAGGRDAQFLADQSRLESDINTNLQGQQGAIEQNLATRGLSGGMSEMVSKNINAQGAANRQAQMAMDSKAQAEQRALQALMQSGQLGGQMQAQDFGQQSAKAQAADNIAKFNAQNRQQVLSNNVAIKNNAQLNNANNAQNTANQNVGLRNEAQQYNQSLDQQNFNNQLSRLGLVGNATAGAAQASQNQARNQDAFIGGMIDSAGKYYSQNKKQPGEE